MILKRILGVIKRRQNTTPKPKTIPQTVSQRDLDDFILPSYGVVYQKEHKQRTFDPLELM